MYEMGVCEIILISYMQVKYFSYLGDHRVIQSYLKWAPSEVIK